MLIFLKSSFVLFSNDIQVIPNDYILPSTVNTFKATILPYPSLRFVFKHHCCCCCCCRCCCFSRVWLLATPMDCSPPASSIHGSFQARVLEWGATAFSNVYKEDWKGIKTETPKYKQINPPIQQLTSTVLSLQGKGWKISWLLSFQF